MRKKTIENEIDIVIPLLPDLMASGAPRRTKMMQLKGIENFLCISTPYLDIWASRSMILR